MHDLHHRTALVGAARTEVFEHLNLGSGWQCPVRLVGGGTSEVVEAVGKHADLDASAVDVQSAFVERLLHLCRRGAAGADAGLGDRTGGFVRRICRSSQRNLRRCRYRGIGGNGCGCKSAAVERRRCCRASMENRVVNMRQRPERAAVANGNVSNMRSGGSSYRVSKNRRC